VSNGKSSRLDLGYWAVVLGLVFAFIWVSDPTLIGGSDILSVLLLVVGFVEVIVLINLGVNWWVHRALVKTITISVTESELELDTITAQKPAYVLIDSLDKELLDCISHVSGDLVRVDKIVTEENLIPTRKELGERLRKLTVLGLIRKPPDYDDVYLTARGRDALNTPAPLFASNISTHLWGRVQDYKIALWQSNWSEALRSVFLLLEDVLRDRMKPIAILDEEKWLEIKEKNYHGKEIIDLTLGQLIGASRQLGILKDGTLEFWLASELNRIRKPFSHSKGGNSGVPTGKDAANVDLLMDIFLQILYSRV